MKQEKMFDVPEAPEVIRTLGMWQPFASLMLHGKVETRKVRKGRKPPFTLGKYLIYSTLKETPPNLLVDWCGREMIDRIHSVLKFEPTRDMRGMALAIGDLYNVRKMWHSDEKWAYVLLQEDEEKDTWCLEFQNVQRIEPFSWKFGQQGIPAVPDSERSKIVILQ